METENPEKKAKPLTNYCTDVNQIIINIMSMETPILCDGNIQYIVRTCRASHPKDQGAYVAKWLDS